jgi:thiamine biosynthesis lipoprotein
LDTFTCLETALDIQRQTGGAFDVAYASAAPAWRGPRFELNPADRAIRVVAPETRLDLGGIGKGFALDRMAALLADWEIASALLAASSSTLLALDAPPGEPGWRIGFGSDHAPWNLWLARGAFSASGRSAQGSHIIDPRTGQPAVHWLRTWATAPNAATADALSTAFLVMPENEILAYCRRHPDVSAYALSSAEAPLHILHEAE